MRNEKLNKISRPAMLWFHDLANKLTKSGHVPSAANRTCFNTDFENIAFRSCYIFMAAVFVLVKTKTKDYKFEKNV
jgi:hypothetical protein